MWLRAVVARCAAAHISGRAGRGERAASCIDNNGFQPHGFIHTYANPLCFRVAFVLAVEDSPDFATWLATPFLASMATGEDNPRVVNLNPPRGVKTELVSLRLLLPELKGM